tara:strand:+ start:1247 stop:1432 length:186 start_codon:yes stop_codon:yes gene_type:complete
MDKDEIIKALKQQILELTMDNAELKDTINNYSFFPETDGYEVGSPSDYVINNQLELFDVSG